MKGFFDSFARVAGIFATQTVLQQLVWVLMCVMLGIFLMIACYIALKHFYNSSNVNNGGRCQVCGSLGHGAAECMEMGIPSACRCQLCGAFGHLAQVCSRFPGSINKMRGYLPGMFYGGGGGGGYYQPYRQHHHHHRRRYHHHRHYGGRKCSGCTHGIFLNTYGVTQPQTSNSGVPGKMPMPGNIGFTG